MSRFFHVVRSPLASTIGASVLWGLFPIYWKYLAAISPYEVLAHRVVWSLVFLFLLLLLQGRVLAVLRQLSLRMILLSGLSSLFIALNWGLYVYAVGAGRVLDASLGYYINPLLSAGVGVLWFDEALERKTVAAFFFGICGLSCMAYQIGNVPLLSLLLAGSFVVYSILRKKSAFHSIDGLFVETLLLTPLAGLLIGIWSSHGTLQFPQASLLEQTLLILGGVVTALPLMLFAYGVRGISLATLGICQYIGPTLQFLLGWLLFHEPLPFWRAIGFVFIWMAVSIYGWSSWRKGKKVRKELEGIAVE